MLYLNTIFKTLDRIINVVCSRGFTEGTITLDDVERLEMTDGFPINPYGTSKLCQFIFHLELTKQIKAAGYNNQVHTYAVCPVECDTNLYRYYEQSWFESLIPGLPAEAVS